MATKLFVGSLAWATTNETLSAHFAQAGTVTSASVIMDKMTGKSRGFGFVEMASEEEALKAISSLNGSTLDDRTITVAEAQPQGDRAGFKPQGRRF